MDIAKTTTKVCCEYCGEANLTCYKCDKGIGVDEEILCVEEDAEKGADDEGAEPEMHHYCEKCTNAGVTVNGINIS